MWRGSVGTWERGNGRGCPRALVPWCPHARSLKALFGAGLFAFALTGCTPTLRSPDEILVVTSRAPGSTDRYDIHRYAWGADRLVAVGATQVGPALEPPRPLTLTSAGDLIVAVREAARGAAVLYELGDGEPKRLSLGGMDSAAAEHNADFDFVLDAGGGKIVLASFVDHPPRPAMRVERGIIYEINPPWLRLTVLNADTGRIEPGPTEPLVPVLRVRPEEWLAIADPAAPRLISFNWQTGARRDVGPWGASRILVGAVLGPGGAWAAIGGQEIGRRWNLFDIWVWNAAADTVQPLVRGVFVANQPLSPFSPHLAMRPVDEERLAFVITAVEEWRDTLPVAGSYFTAITDVPRRSLLCRIRHPGGGLHDQTPEPYLPEDRLNALRITPLPPVARSGRAGEPEPPGEAWRRFFSFRSGQLVCVTGRLFKPAELDLYAYTRDGGALAVRRRVAEGNGADDECLALVGDRETPALKIPQVERVTWLPRRGPKPATAETGQRFLGLPLGR
jgi:hypothetical protein